MGRRKHQECPTCHRELPRPRPRFRGMNRKLIGRTRNQDARMDGILRGRDWACPPEEAAWYHDRSPSCWGVPGYMQAFSTYLARGLMGLERAFIDRMRFPEIDDTKASLRKEIKGNPNLHWKIRARLLTLLSRVSMRRDWVRVLDSGYMRQIQAMKPGDPHDVLYAKIAGDTNLPAHYRENLLDNLVRWTELPKVA